MVHRLRHDSPTQHHELLRHLLRQRQLVRPRHLELKEVGCSYIGKCQGQILVDDFCLPLSVCLVEIPNLLDEDRFTRVMLVRHFELDVLADIPGHGRFRHHHTHDDTKQSIDNPMAVVCQYSVIIALLVSHARFMWCHSNLTLVLLLILLELELAKAEACSFLPHNRSVLTIFHNIVHLSLTRF